MGYDRDIDLDDPRAEAGYQPLDRKPPAVPVSLPSSSVGRCATCPADGVALHVRRLANGNVVRDRCAHCEGIENRESVEITRDVIRQLKAAIAQGQTVNEADVRERLGRLIGGDRVHEIANTVRSKMESGGGRRAR